MVLAQSRIFSQIAPKICAVFWRNLEIIVLPKPCSNYFPPIPQYFLLLQVINTLLELQNDGNKR